MNDIFLYHVQMCPAVKGVVDPDENGDYTIYINNIYSYEQQLEIYNHEMTHIIEGHHCDNIRSVEEIEHEAEARAVLVERIKHAELNGLSLNSAILREPEEYDPGLARLDAILDELKDVERRFEKHKRHKKIQDDLNQPA